MKCSKHAGVLKQQCTAANVLTSTADVSKTTCHTEHQSIMRSTRSTMAHVTSAEVIDVSHTSFYANMRLLSASLEISGLSAMMLFTSAPVSLHVMVAVSPPPQYSFNSSMHSRPKTRAICNCNRNNSWSSSFCSSSSHLTFAWCPSGLQT